MTTDALYDLVDGKEILKAPRHEILWWLRSNILLVDDGYFVVAGGSMAMVDIPSYIKGDYLGEFAKTHSGNPATCCCIVCEVNRRQKHAEKFISELEETKERVRLERAAQR